MDPTTYRDSDYTPVKQNHLRHVLNAIMGRIHGTRLKYPEWARQYTPIYIDLFSGPGKSSDQSDGSPLIFCDIAAHQSYKMEAHFYERNQEDAEKLEKNLALINCDCDCYYVHHKDNSAVTEILPTIAEDRFGIAYADPSNARLDVVIPPLSAIAKAYRCVDIVINYAAASWKRQNDLDHYEELMLMLPNIWRKRWIIREPIDRFQWTMLVGTNHLSFRLSKSRGWYDVDSAYGRDLFMRVNSTTSQLKTLNYKPLKVKQLELFK